MMKRLVAMSEVERVVPNAFFALSAIDVLLNSNSALGTARSTS